MERKQTPTVHFHGEGDFDGSEKKPEPSKSKRLQRSVSSNELYSLSQASEGDGGLEDAEDNVASAQRRHRRRSESEKSDRSSLPGVKKREVDERQEPDTAEQASEWVHAKPEKAALSHIQVSTLHLTSYSRSHGAPIFVL